ncbi:MAG: RepB family DNA primase [Planctomycetes bacterium]|nr:RepB family DNA primase [Planctomycetota bacterium]
MPALLHEVLSHLLKLSAEQRLNLFFGVCPRAGTKGRFDLAWQIRTVRALWTDIDLVSPDEAQLRVAKAGLPHPSIIVNSGNGVHLYWLLDSPYVIDDAGDPLPIETEWTKTQDGRNKPRKYIVENGEQIYLEQRRHVSRLTPRAEHLQDVLAGIAKVLGGDHTTDLSRLLRLPGTFNRKDQRNGREPVPTVLVECDATRKYPLPTFDPLKSCSPETERVKQIAAMPLPRVRKASTSKADKLAELIAASAIAPAGTRSETDFAVCCYAIRNAIAKEEVWSQVEQVGKFADQGRRYFDHTWENAEYDCRAATFDKLQKRLTAKPSNDPTHAIDHNAVGNGEPAAGVDHQGAGRPTIVVDPQTMPVGDTLHQVTDCLLSAGNCFSRAEQLVVINNDQISSILSSPELAGLLNQHVEFYFVDGDGGQYKPLPPAYAGTWLNHHVERGRLPLIKLFTRNPVYTEDWRLVAPGFDDNSGIYYAGPTIEARSGTDHLDALLKDFCFRTPADRTNYIGMLLTPIVIPRFIGSKPGALFNGNQPNLGKSMLAQIISILRDGQLAETASYNPNDEEFEKRIGAIVRRGATTIIIDNAKSKGRNPRIDSACLERSITDPILSFRLLGQSESIRAENSHIFCITANTPDVSRDLVTRSVVINLYYEGDPERREFSIPDPEGYVQQHRNELLGELIGMVERWKASGMPMAKVHSRFNKRSWGNIVGGILETCGEPDFLANAEEAAALLDETRREFTELVGVLVEHPQGIWTAAELVELCSKHGLMAVDLGEGSPRSLSTKMGTLAGRFIEERFPLSDGRTAVFHRSDGRKGKLYRVSVEDELPNVDGVAEPLPNLAHALGSAR